VVGVRGRPPIGWEDRVVEYVNERGGGSFRGLDNARTEKSGDSSAMVIP